MITGHGCFNVYLHKIGKATSPICAHCGEEFDTADHTLLDCTEWSKQRRVLEETFGGDFTLGTIFTTSLENPAKWKTFTDFCENVISSKEEAERVRQSLAGIRPRRRRPPRARNRSPPT